MSDWFETPPHPTHLPTKTAVWQSSKAAINHAAMETHKLSPSITRAHTNAKTHTEKDVRMELTYTAIPSIYDKHGTSPFLSEYYCVR